MTFRRTRLQRRDDRGSAAVVGSRASVALAVALLTGGLVLATASPGVAATVDWVTQFGTSSGDQARGIALDASGNAYVSGITGAAFPGETYAGSGDAFLARFDPSGTRVWVHQLGSTGEDYGHAVAVDAAGNAYLAGYAKDALPGQSSVGSSDAFLAKYDPTGARLWVRQFGTPGGDEAWAVAVDAAGNAYVAGSIGTYDAFVAKYDPTGNQLWMSQFEVGTPDLDQANTVAVDAGGDVYVGGQTYVRDTQNYDAFVARFDSSGAELWVRQLGSTSSDVTLGVAVDSDANAYLSGYTDATLPGQISAGGTDAFLAKFDSSGSEVWVRQFGTAGLDVGWGLALDSSGEPYIGGQTSGAFAGETSAGNFDAFVAQFDRAGSQLWVRQFGTPSLDGGYGVAIDSSGDAYVPGGTLGTFEGQASLGGFDAFVAKIGPSGASDQLSDLAAYVSGLGPGASLGAKVAAAQAALASGDTGGACSSLAALVNEAEAQSGKKLTVDQASQIIAAATGIRDVLGC